MSQAYCDINRNINLGTGANFRGKGCVHFGHIWVKTTTGYLGRSGLSVVRLLTW